MCRGRCLVSTKYRWVITGLVFFITVVNYIVSTAAATGFVMLFAVRLMLGVAEVPNFPAMNRVVGDWLPSDERAIALANALVIALNLSSVIGVLLFHHPDRPFKEEVRI